MLPNARCRLTALCSLHQLGPCVARGNKQETACATPVRRACKPLVSSWSVSLCVCCVCPKACACVCPAVCVISEDFRFVCVMLCVSHLGHVCLCVSAVCVTSELCVCHAVSHLSPVCVMLYMSHLRIAGLGITISTSRLGFNLCSVLQHAPSSSCV